MKNSSSPLGTSPVASTKRRKISSIAKEVRESEPQPYHPLSDLEAGDVFVVGSGDCGQLGLGQDILEKERPALLEFFRDKQIIKVKAGGLHNLALSKTGEVYSWGCNDQSALGRGGEETEPGLVTGLPSSIISLACGDSCSVALTSDGRVFCWGTFRDNNGIFGLFCDTSVQSVPRIVKELRNIIFIDAGANHIVAVSREGKVYTWGVGEQGQLGRRVMSRHVKESSLIPRPINFRPYKLSNKFQKAFAGGYHTFLLHETGSLFSCGLNNYGQLGTGDTTSVEVPEEVVGVEMIASVGGGEHHSVALDTQGRVWSWGRCDSGQCGIETDQDHLPEPVLVPNLDGMTHISAGGAFCLCSNSKFLYGWGYGEMGQLANDSQDSPTPHLFSLKDRGILDMAAGGQHSVLLLTFKK